MMGAAYLGRPVGNNTPTQFTSDREQKRDIQAASTKGALSAVKDTPVALWRYKENAAAADGGAVHVGPMVQDLQRNAGNAVAPEGKKIDLISANGLLMGSIQELSKQVDSIASRVGGSHGTGKSGQYRGGKQFVAALAHESGSLN